MCFETYIDEYSLVDELVYREALTLRRRLSLSGLHDLYRKAWRLGASEETLREIERLIEEVEDELARRAGRSIARGLRASA